MVDEEGRIADDGESIFFVRKIVCVLLALALIAQ